MSPALHLSVALPELTLATGAMVLLLVGVFTRKEQAELILWSAVLVLALAGFFVLRESGTITLFGESFIVDPFARALKLLTLTGSAVTLIMQGISFETIAREAAIGTIDVAEIDLLKG